MPVGPDPTFSIAVPVRGQAAFLRTALESIRAQTTRVELAVLDASPDAEAQRVVEPYASMVAYRYHRPDAGQAAAIQEGWARTSGEIVAWLNADDYYFPDTLARVADVFQAHPEVDVLYGHAVCVSADGAFQMYFPAVDPDIRAITRRCVVCQPACFVRREAMERVGGLDPTLHYTMDWDLWMRLHRAGSTFRFLEAPLAAVRMHAATKTLSGHPRRYQEIRRLLGRAGVPWPQRLATLIAFRCYDLRSRPRGPLTRALARLLAAAARVRRARRPAVRISGIECRTNRVAADCVVELPWYDAAPPGRITLVIDRSRALTATCNGQVIVLRQDGAVRTVFLGEPLVGQVYRGALVPAPTRRLSCRLDARAGPWRLLSLRADPEP